MLEYYDKDGSPLETLEWARKLENYEYKRVANEVVIGRYRVSTVWLGLEHGTDGKGRPLIFETMVFPCTDAGAVTHYGDLDCVRTATEIEALRAHKRMVKKWSNATSKSAERRLIDQREEHA